VDLSEREGSFFYTSFTIALMSKFLLFIFFVACVFIPNSQAQTYTISKSNPLSSSIVLDNNTTIKITSNYTSEKLTVQFNSTKNSQHISFVPEILIATNNSEKWDSNTHWFHTSYGNCYGNGHYYFWDDCNSNPDGWSVKKNKSVSENVTFTISWKKLGITPQPGLKLYLSFKLSSPENMVHYWPKKADIVTPNSWAIVTLK